VVTRERFANSPRHRLALEIIALPNNETLINSLSNAVLMLINQIDNNQNEC